MSDLLITTKSGKVVNAKMGEAVDHLLKLHKTMDQWSFIAKLITFWAARDPELARSYSSKTQNEKYRGEAKNDFAATDDLSFRRLLDVPVALWDLITFFYPEAIKDRAWQMQFATRFPQFKVPEKL